MIRSKKGGILIYMLGMIALLSIVVTEFLLETATEIRYRSQVTHRDDLRILAYSALETTVAVLAEIKTTDDGLYSSKQEWENPLKYAKFSIPKDYTVSVTIRDETGKLSIYEEDLKTFGNLMGEMDISYEYIGNMKTELKAWLAKPNEVIKDTKLKPGEKPKAESTGGKKEPEAKPKADESKPGEELKPGEKLKDEKEEEKKPQRVVYNFLQLKELPAFERVFFDKDKNPNEKFKLLKDSVSLLHKGPLNINTAPDMIRKLILGDLHMGPNVEEKKYYRSMKELGFEGESAKELEKVIGFKSRVLDIDIQVARGAVKYYLSAIVDFGSESNDSDKSKSKDKLKDPNSPKDLEKSKDPNASKDSKNKGDFTFLALTEDQTFDN